jgi:protein O-GlcNAc transferase
MPDGGLIPAELGLLTPERSPAGRLNRAIQLDRAGHSGPARELMRQLAAGLPDWDEPRLRLAESLRGGSATDAEAARNAWRAVLALNPNREQALLALGAMLIEAGSPLDATIPLLRCCGIAKYRVDAWSTLGRAYQDAGIPELALAAFIRAQRLAPKEIAHAHRLVNAALAAGQGPREAARLEARSEQDPLNPIPHIARGVILDRLGLLDPAIDALEVACALAPDNPTPFVILAGVLSRTARLHQAERAFGEAARLDPQNPQLMNDHATMLMRLNRHAEARVLLLEVLHRGGPDSAVLCNLANAKACLGLQDEAVELAHAAIVIEPGGVLPRRTLTSTLPYMDGVTGALLLRAARECSATLPRGGLPILHKTPGRDRPLTIGLLSGTLRTHPVGWLTVAGFENLDPSAFQIVCLSRAPEPNDPISRRFQAVARSWENVSKLDDAGLARHGRELGLDILIDLAGHGDASRMPACARRLAPVQIKWVGMQNHTSGLAEMDWFLTDRWETPPALEATYSERMLRMPDGYVCYSAPPHAPDVAPAPFLRNGFVTFGCFNNIAKITPRVIATWGEIMRNVPDSRLILKTHQFGDPPTGERFRAVFGRHGVDPSRIETRGSSSHRAFLASYNEVDFVLDPFPYSGGLTTCEALWMGVPTVTLPGESFASRHSASHLSNAGFPDWVARDLAHYIEMAVSRAQDVDGLVSLRPSIRARVRASPLCDAPRFGQALGLALRHAWTA